MSRARTGRRTGLRVAIVLVILALLIPMVIGRFAGCEAPPTVTIWHSFAADSPEHRLLSEALGVIANESEKIVLRITAKGDGLGTALAAATKAGEFPDIVVAPAEWAPTLDRALSTYRLPLAADDDWLPAIRAALAREGQLLALPLFCAVDALGRSPQLADQPWPTTLTQLAAAATAAEAAGQGSLSWPADDAYATLPFYLKAGGEIEPSPAAGGDPVWDADPVVDGTAARRWLAAAKTLAELAAGRTGTTSATDWQQGKVSFAALPPTLCVALKAAGINLTVGQMPETTPLLNTWVALLMRDAGTLNSAAVEMVIRLTADHGDGLTYLSSVMGLLPPMDSHFAAPVVTAAGLAGYRELVKAALPMPAGKYATEVWALYEAALAESLAGAKAEDVVARLIDRVEELASETSVNP